MKKVKQATMMENWGQDMCHEELSVELKPKNQLGEDPRGKISRENEKPVQRP